MKTNLLLTLVLVLFFSSCITPEKPKDFDYGKVVNGKYVNSYFDFELTLPKDWKVQTKEQMEALSNQGKELAAGDDSRMKAILKASDITSANLLSVFQFERGSAVEFNPSISIVAENVHNAPGIKTGNEYLFQARRLMMQTQMKYDYIDEKFAKEIISGTDFYKMNAEIKYMGLDIKQIYFATIVKGFSIVLITSFVSDQQKNDLLGTISTLKFKK